MKLQEYFNMAINQSQVDHIISTASVDDPEIQLQQLKEEVDLIKKSIKKLLIDIRERMNELENPFVITSAVPDAGVPASRHEEAPSAQKTAAAEPVPQAPLLPAQAAPAAAPPAPVSPLTIEGMQRQLSSDEHLLLSLQEKLGETKKQETAISEKLRLQKVHKLFEWTSRMVRKYGHDRLEIMIESYATMGYISGDACAQIREIARLMPESIGESHEIGPDEFVAELYGLNRIITPGDKSLDRDMIEVLMEHRQKSGIHRKVESPADDETGEDWIDVLDRN
jgi:hypothetical protein